MPTKAELEGVIDTMEDQATELEAKVFSLEEANQDLVSANMLMVEEMEELRSSSAEPTGDLPTGFDRWVAPIARMIREASEDCNVTEQAVTIALLARTYQTKYVAGGRTVACALVQHMVLTLPHHAP